MPFREKLKKTFSRNSHSASNSESSSTLSKSNSRRNSNNHHNNHEYYKPGEKIPQPKYRRPVDPAHKERLEAFSFASAWRRMSAHSQYSPMGSRIPSRRGSVISNVRKSIGSRRGDGSVSEAEGTNQIGSDLSRQVTVTDSETSDPMTKRLDFATSNGSNVVPAVHGTPFTQEDLNLAMKRTRLDVSV